MNWFYHNDGFVRITAVGILTVFPPYHAPGSVLSYIIFSLVSASPECQFLMARRFWAIYAFYCFTNVTLVLRREIISNNLVYHDLMLRCFLFLQLKLEKTSSG